MSVLVFVEQRDGAVRQVGLETLAAGRTLADGLGVSLEAVLVGPPTATEEAARLGKHGADVVALATTEAFSEYSPEGFTDVLVKRIGEREPKAVVFPASALGKDLSPRVAARLRLGLASDVTELDVEDGRVVAVRPVYAGKIFMKVGFKTEPALLSVRPRAFAALENPREPEIESLAVEIDDTRPRTTVRREVGERKERPDVAEAEIVVSGGRGMQGPEHWSLLEGLADALGPGTALGASRAVVDAGWRPHAEQVGQTGKVVAPPLYFAIGISGAIQHLAGMRTAKCIVAVNKDADAPIFKIADYGIVGDIFEVLPRLTEEIRRLRAEE